MLIKVTENVYVENGMVACNVGFLVTKQGVVVIDTPMRPTDIMKFRDEASKKGEIRYVINTEEHPDHWQGSYFFPGLLITHQETRNRLMPAKPEEVMERVKQMDPEGIPLMKGYKVSLADITFDENLTIHLGDHTIKLFHLPGHSPGGIGVYLPEERVVFTTDIVFHKWKSWLHESEPTKWLASLKKLESLNAAVIVPGHGDICPRNYLQEEATIVSRWVELVKSAIQKGQSEEEAAATIVCPDPHPKQPGTPMTPEQLNRAIISRLYQLCKN